MSLLAAALGAADSGDKVRANAVRAIGYIVAAGPQSSNAQTQPQHQSSTCNGAHAPQSSGEAACAAVDPPLLSPSHNPHSADSPSAAAEFPGSLDAHAQPNPQSADALDECDKRGAEQRPRSASCCSERDSTRGVHLHGEWPPDWFVRWLGCLREALATGNGKVQWNACYAIGSLLRRTDSVAAADACGCLLTLLAQLLDVLQHSANFKVLLWGSQTQGSRVVMSA